MEPFGDCKLYFESIFADIISIYWIGNHTIAIIKGHESYELLKTSCSTIFEQVNKLVDEKKIEVNGISIPVEVYLGGDYKVYSYIM